MGENPRSPCPVGYACDCDLMACDKPENWLRAIGHCRRYLVHGLGYCEFRTSLSGFRHCLGDAFHDSRVSISCWGARLYSSPLWLEYPYGNRWDLNYSWHEYLWMCA